jgi:putative heme-binding domain-containing protein
MTRRIVFLIALGAALALQGALPPTLVRTTEALSPAREAKSFTLPPGFRIQLFASEPDIAKPMNLAFDTRGRLWVTSTLEYPFPAKPGQRGRDAIKILEDTNGDGRADKITTFVDGLNIPTGLYPYQDGVIAWSIPNIWFFRDGDGKADQREKLFGPLGYERDTHGMNSSFTRGFDGWLHITHGFNNTSTVLGRDGSSITMNSGNTYRVRLDGSRVEQFTWGQVNPFGMCLDPRGNFYTADCHSSPVYQLIAGAHYPSFGKPHDGLGFAPRVIQHSHGSTGIAGIAYYADNLWPAEFRDNIFVGNVVTSRVNRDRLAFHGSSPKGTELPDLVTSNDPWFRPVDLQFGPDGALYIADFYNRIIGHYEVPLTHPGRDRKRGRIWRITYKGRSHPKLNLATPAKAIAELGHPNFARRQLATHHLADTLGAPAIPPLKKLLASGKATPEQKVHGMWALHRLGKLDGDKLASLTADKHPLVRGHALRALGALPKWDDPQRRLAFAALGATDPHVRRAAAEALARHPSAAAVREMLAATAKLITHDTLQVKGSRGPDVHLIHTLRIALRNHLRQPGAFAAVRDLPKNPTTAPLLTTMALSIPEAGAAEFLLDDLPADEAQATRALRHIARHLPAARLGELATLAQKRHAGQIDLQAELLRAVRGGVAERGGKMPDNVRDWGAKLAARLLAEAGVASPWSHTPLVGSQDKVNPWDFQNRRCADGRTAKLLSSFPHGERRTGVLRSRSFVLPAKLSFYLAGHDGFPNKAAKKRNVVRLRDAATQAVLREVFPPRNDTAQKITWNLSAYKGRRGFVEVTDGDSAGAYAWLAFGRFVPALPEVALVHPRKSVQSQVAAAEFTRDLRLTNTHSALRRLSADSNSDATARGAAIEALLTVQPTAAVRTMAASVLTDAGQTEILREATARVSASQPEMQPALAQALATAPAAFQLKFARAMARHPAGMKTLFKSIEAGKAPAALLWDAQVKARLTKPDQKRAAQLMKNLPPANEAIAKLIGERLNEYGRKGGDAARGAEVFKTICAACHQKGGTGGNIGPQLDGLASRGAERLVEDILDPNRNVDIAFRYAIVKLKNGQVMLGLKRRELGQTIVFADLTGKETAVPKADIASQTQTTRSIMPDTLGVLLNQNDFSNLLQFLLAK